ncbi:MAG: fibronectin type III domain-containing protein [Planctomycetes bacterium]|nr:fibronectin type III domain-containing protein [Planctomycetota bacterium]
MKKPISLALVLAALSIMLLAAGCSKKDSQQGGTGISVPIPDTTAPDNITDLQILAQEGKVTLTWNASPSTDVAGYKIYASTDDGVTFDSGINVGNNLIYEYTGLTNGTKYTFRVTAYDTETNESNLWDTNILEVSATPNTLAIDNTPPESIKNLEIVPGDMEVTFTWIASKSSDVAGYRIYASINNGSTFDTGTDVDNVTSYNMVDLTNGINYIFHVVAYDGSLNESEFVEGSATPGSSTIVATAYPPGGIYNDDSITITLTNTISTGEIYYSTDGTNPSMSGPLKYSETGPVTITLPAGAFATGIKLKYLASEGTNAGITKTELYELVPPTLHGADSFYKFSGMRKRRQGHTSNVIPTSEEFSPGVLYEDVFLCGGVDARSRNVLDDGEIYTLKLEHYENLDVTNDQMQNARIDHTATLLDEQDIDNDGSNEYPVLILGGRNDYTAYAGTDTVSIYNHKTRSFTASADVLSQPRFLHTATKLYDGRVLVIGGVPQPNASTLTYASLSCDNDVSMYTEIDTYDLSIWVNVESGDIAQISHMTGTTEYAVITSAVNATQEEPAYISVVQLIEAAVSGDVFSIYKGKTLTAEMFNADGTKGSFLASTTINTQEERIGHQATLLQNGTVLLTGGYRYYDYSNNAYYSKFAEIYNPAVEAFRYTINNSQMNAIRFFHQATLLHDGRVLITGGTEANYGKVNGLGTADSYYISTWAIYSSSEMFNPVNEKFEPLQETMDEKRFLHRATLLQDGTVLITGGYNGALSSYGLMTNTAEIFDPVNLTFTPVGNMIKARAEHTADLLPDGTVLISGGTGFTNPSGLAEIYDPATKTFRATAHSLTVDRAYAPTATPLVNGNILISGGAILNPGTDLDYKYQSLICNSSAEYYDTSRILFMPVTNNMSSVKIFHAGTTLDNGTIILTGGFDGLKPVASCDLYNPATNSFTPTFTAMFNARYKHTATKMLDGKVLITGGDSVYGALNTAEIYNPLTGVFQTTLGNMNKSRTDHSANLLPDGRVLISGGSGIFDTSTEIFDPAQQTFTAGPDLNLGRIGHKSVSTIYAEGRAKFINASPIAVGTNTQWFSKVAANDLMYCNSNGKIYVILSVDSDTQLTLSSNYTGTTSTDWEFYTIVKLNPLIVGSEVNTKETELYNFSTSGIGSFSITSNNMNYGRYGHTVTALNDMRIIAIAGDTDAPLPINSNGTADIFTPILTSNTVSNGTFGPTIFMDDLQTNWHATAKLNIGILIIIQGHDAQAFFPKTNYP